MLKPSFVISDKGMNIRKRNAKKESDSKDVKQENQDVEEKPKLKYGPLPRFPNQRIWSRGIMILGVLIYIWYFSKDKSAKDLARQNEVYDKRGQVLDCSFDFLNDIKQYPSCVPQQCGRYVNDKLVTANEAEILLKLAQRGMAFGGSQGGATILDLHSGALSLNDKFVNIYTNENNKILTPTDLTVYKLVRSKIQHAIAENFGIDADSIYLTYPTFFSRLTSLDAKTIHDEYWHKHIDKETYESFHYTSLLYLNDYGIDFKGGKFVFMDRSYNSTVEPRKGRVLMFTSGSENPHLVERVSVGLRFAITISFTCDKSKAINDPNVK